jgi:hypothetical protein
MAKINENTPQIASEVTDSLGFTEEQLAFINQIILQECANLTARKAAAERDAFQDATFKGVVQAVSTLRNEVYELHRTLRDQIYALQTK